MLPLLHQKLERFLHCPGFPVLFLSFLPATLNLLLPPSLLLPPALPLLLPLLRLRVGSAEEACFDSAE